MKLNMSNIAPILVLVEISRVSMVEYIFAREKKNVLRVYLFFFLQEKTMKALTTSALGIT